MPTVRCGCGATFDAPPGDAICASCGSVHEVAEAPIAVQCFCGAMLKAPAHLAGKLVKCPTCAQPVKVTGPAAAATPPPQSKAEPPAAMTAKQRVLIWMFAVAVVPLAVYTVSDTDDPGERLNRQLENDPDTAEKARKAKTLDELLAALPGNRIEGALHERGSGTHWLYAIVAAGAFWGLLLLLYPRGNTSSGRMWAVGIGVGTVGILFLLGVQFVAAWSQGFNLVGRSIIVILFYIVKFIGFSYRAATDPSNGFILSMLGFTFGVGLCEELCKSMPAIVHYRGANPTLDVRGAALWGLAAGIGFGVSEGIMYSSDYYNGITTGGIYVVRFVSCVALHAVWSGASAILLWRRQEELQEVEDWYGPVIPVLKLLGISIVLHGLYDTLLKREMAFAALIVAAASFAWFFWLFESSLKHERRLAAA